MSIKEMDNNKLLFGLNIPTKIYYGRKNLSDSLAELSQKYGYLKDSVMIVTTGGSLIRFGHLDRLTESIRKNGLDVKISVFDGVSANPKLSEIEEGVKEVKRGSIRTIIGFGGGSALDSAKAIACGAVCEKSVTELFRSGTEPEKSLPVIAIPTTAGTGSELSKAAIISDEENCRKGGLRGESLYPRVAIVDSEFTETVPFLTTMETGFDVLAHAVESYVSRAASPFTEMLSEYVIREAGISIRRLVRDLNDVETRFRMCYCSLLMGINLGNASTALPHRMQYPIGAHTDSSHGAGLAALYPSWVKYEEKYSAEKIKKVYELMNVEEIEEILSLMKINRRLSDFGVKKEMIRVMTKEVTGNIYNDPAAKEENIVEKIYMDSL